MGQISSLVIDNTNGRVALVVLSNVPNIGGAEMAIPYRSLMRTGEATFTFNPGDMTIQAGSYGYYSDPFVATLTWAPGTSDLYGLPSRIDAEWVSYLYRHYGQEPYWTQPGEQTPKDLELYDSGKIMGARVQISGGTEMARVNDLVIDSSDGHITFVVLSGVPGRNDPLVAAPFSACSRTGEDVFVLNVTADQLASAPGFDEFADLDNVRYAANVYLHFGLQPHWTERTAIPAMNEPMMEGEHFKESSLGYLNLQVEAIVRKNSEGTFLSLFFLSLLSSWVTRGRLA